ncbi:unnamed protein product [Didymodactylos carnosus]|uniref:Uncharacterized protein n=1 Tax=Didymodactylos carnosus TaxID=1234261 RepID=A0A8S2YSH6_9BILA|nr:unnamed protein product [Didymodactylos carnosus]
MASGKHNIHTSSLKPNDVSKNLITGTFALKWPEENTKSLTPIAVNLHVDYKGYILFCLNKVTKVKHFNL